MEMAGEVLPVVKETPVLAGVCGTDPFRLMPKFLREVDEAGFAGVQNFPTVGLFDGEFRANLEETGMGYGLEVEMIGAHTAKSLDDCVELIQAMRDAAVAINPDVTVLCHGGPIAEPEDAAYVLERATGVAGFFGASSMERLPTEVAMTENMKRFKALAV